MMVFYFFLVAVLGCILVYFVIFFFKQKTAYEMRISDWSSDVCSSDLEGGNGRQRRRFAFAPADMPAGRDPDDERILAAVGVRGDLRHGKIEKINGLDRKSVV